MCIFRPYNGIFGPSETILHRFVSLFMITVEPPNNTIKFLQILTTDTPQLACYGESVVSSKDEKGYYFQLFRVFATIC